MKHQHQVMLWAQRGPDRTLELEADGPAAPARARRRVRELMRDPRVDTIELNSHDLVESGDLLVRGGGLRSWVRRGHSSSWRCLGSNRQRHPHR